ncbi:hypothetical protein FIBSPDRAFT_444886 [Athelia psychrophila]|uniref:Xylanolytic transcriptional activator regulatory domain-containing protein n=1 Tax=Athelia psychrophila TaxID=1759441 RepID=A0A166M8M7_9AGAM|nr:hypothetical protein FIBSPDRAFT_444886 [Fibularhizoctonia sp. CBS 109695]
MRVSDSQSHQERWLLGGTCARLAHIIGLQRESVSRTLNKEENQRRRVLFWELYTVEATSSGMMGLPPSFSLQHTDCQFPIDTEPHTTSHGASEPGYHNWKRRFAADCMSTAMQFVCSARPQPYEDLVQLEKRLRHTPTPHHLQSPAEPSDTNSSWSLDPMTAYQQYLVVAFRENTILYIHRIYFVQALREEPLDPFQHKLAPSVQAAYKSATQLVSSMRGLHEAHPQVAHDQWWLWTALFSACTILGALAVEAPRCAAARDAMLALEQAVHLFEIGLDLFHAPPMLVGFPIIGLMVTTHEPHQ